ncbi:MAG: carbohydrate ABC transporter permease [Epulopiscium sp.]|nr:carbohydrate ABC transporter permease [Candidatus Epulonipiscium sp.]
MAEKFSFKKEHRARTIFHIVNFIFFAIVVVAMLIPIIKVFVDSLDTSGSYGMRLWPQNPSFSAYKIIFTTTALYKPFLISVYVTALGTFLGLLMCTIGAYVLIQFEMPGRTFFSYLLLFTMIFNGGLVPTYLVMRDLKLLNTLWAIILPASLNVYNLILMRNFFEGIPRSLFEAAEIDGCTPFGIFTKVVLPLSKPALASIGLFFAVAFWNQYTNFTIYISNPRLYNFQVKLRSLIIDDQSLAAASSEGIYAKTVQNAAIIVAVLPFVFIYPFCQKYFVTGITMGAVKE